MEFCCFFFSLRQLFDLEKKTRGDLFNDKHKYKITKTQNVFATKD